MDNGDFEYWVQVMQNLVFIGKHQVQAGNGAHALYFIENEVIPAAKSLRDTLRHELGWPKVD